MSVSPRPDARCALDVTGAVQEGQTVDAGAWRELLDGYTPQLHRFARARMPAQVRVMTDSLDVVQDAVVSVYGQLRKRRFVARHEGALRAYLRTAVRNRIVDITRRASRVPMCVNLTDYADPGRSPLERVVQLENTARYRWALRRLTPRDRMAIILRFEHFASYAELAQRLGLPTTNAARVMLSRALRRLGAALAERGGPARWTGLPPDGQPATR